MLRMTRPAFNIFGVSFFFFCFVKCFAQEASKDQYMPNQFALNPIVVPVIQKEKLLAYYIFEIVFESQDEQMNERTKRYIPRIIDKVITALYGVTYSFWTEDTPVTQNQIETLLLKEIRKILPKGKIPNMNLQNFKISLIRKTNQSF